MRGLACVIWLLAAACGFQHGNGAATSADDAASGGSNTGSNGGSGGSNSGGCVSGQRACQGTNQSGVCVGGTVQVDRDCPPTSLCANGYCQPPAGAASCADDASRVAGDVCDLYVQSGALQGFCTATGPGNGGADASCNSDSDCTTGICVQGQCYGACTGATMCPHNQDCDTFSCRSDTLTLEGVTTAISTCHASSC